MKSRTGTLGVALLSLLVFAMTSCSGGADTSATTTVAPSTTIGKNPQNELGVLADSLKAVDYSRISEGDCGKFALVVEKNRVKFFEWKENSWQENSAVLGADSEIEPFMVTTADFTGDNVYEFLVSYNKDGQQGGHEFGGIFMQVDCRWQWAKFNDYYDTGEVMDLLTYDKPTKELTASGEGPNGRTDMIVTFNSTSKQFDAQTLSADDAEYGSDQGSSPAPSPSPVSVVGVRCKDGLALSSGCYAIYSDGSTRGINGQGPWIGRVVSSTQFYDAMGSRICVLIYENGRGKSSYC